MCSNYKDIMVENRLITIRVAEYSQDLPLDASRHLHISDVTQPEGGYVQVVTNCHHLRPPAHSPAQTQHTP